MAPTKSSAVPVAQTDFPLYTIRALGDRHFLVAGGGGQAKTGISNCLEIYEIKWMEGSLVALRVLRHETGSRAIMCTAVSPEGNNFMLAAGMEGLCQLYMLRHKLVAPRDTRGSPVMDSNLRKRKGKHTQSQDYKSVSKQVSFDVDTLDSMQTDFDKDYPFQKVVAMNRPGTMIATGGADGHLRIWKYPTLKKLHEIKAHKNEIDDLDVHPKGNRVVTVSRDGHAYIWKAKEGTLECELNWPKKTLVSYRMRGCRYGHVVDRKDQFVLFTLHIPSKREKVPLPCYITKWETECHSVRRVVSSGTDELSACAISDEGVYLGVGTISGSVSVYISFSLQRLYHVAEAHSIFVTGLEFLSSSETARAITGDKDFTLMSISVDNQVKVHQPPQRSMMSFLWALGGFIIIVYLLFWALTAFGL